MKGLQRLFLSIFVFLLIFGLLVTPSYAQIQPGGGFDFSALDTYLQTQVKNNRIPGLAVAIVKDDQVVFIKGYGEASPGVPVTSQTQFYIGSVTKTFTGLAIMKLVEEGKLELDAPVQKYLPWFEVADEQVSKQITVRNLLTHTSGLSEKGDPNTSAYTSSLEEQARLLRFVRPNAAVGSTYQYYNQNYRLAGLLIEQVSGQKYADYLQSNIFTPLGMVNSVSDPANAPALAQGYSRVFGFPLPRSQTYIPGALPSGYLITTAGDMARYLIAQINNKQVNGEPMLSAEALAEMRTPPAGIGSDYALGWVVMENGNTLYYGGALDNFQCFTAFGLKEKTGFVVLFNQNSIENMMFENSTIRDGLLNFLNGKTLQPVNYGWIGWVLLGLAAADLANHLRLFLNLPRWNKKLAGQTRRTWAWMRTLAGILIPLVIIIGLPLLVKILQGGSPTWTEPFKLMPDITVWLLLGLGLDLVRGIIRVYLLARRRTGTTA